jgi:D-sedoheptulose 7-phosphate isomerase
MLNLIRKWFQDSAKLQLRFVEEQAENLLAAARTIAGVFNNGGKIIIFGNGGSAADAQHIAAEFVNKFRIERPPLPALALTTDTSVLTSIGNDYSFDEIFVKQIKALGRNGDAALAISTSGRSANVLAGIREARFRGLTTIGLCGGDGGPLAREVDLPLVVFGTSTPQIQEVHLMIEHLLCELVDELLFLAPGKDHG